MPWMMEVFRDPSKRATLICDSSFSELSQYKFLESQSKARPRQFTMSVKQSKIKGQLHQQFLQSLIQNIPQLTKAKQRHNCLWQRILPSILSLRLFFCGASCKRGEIWGFNHYDFSIIESRSLYQSTTKDLWIICLWVKVNMWNFSMCVQVQLSPRWRSEN